MTRTPKSPLSKRSVKSVPCPYHGECEWVSLENLQACSRCFREMPGAFKLRSFTKLLDKPKVKITKAWAWKWDTGDVAHFVLGLTAAQCREAIKARGWGEGDLKLGKPVRVEIRELSTLADKRKKGKR